MFVLKRRNKIKRRPKTKLPYLYVSSDNEEDVMTTNVQQMPILNDMRNNLQQQQQPYQIENKSQQQLQQQQLKQQTSDVTTSTIVPFINELLMPERPMLAAPEIPEKITHIHEYIYEEKYDGERMLSIVFDSQHNKCFTRTLRQSHIFKYTIPLKPNIYNCIFDGELVYLDDNDCLVPICDTGVRTALKLQYRIFDIQMYNGANIMFMPLLERKRLLQTAIFETDYVKLSKYYECKNLKHTMQAFDDICKCGGEGLILKHRDLMYTPNVRQWIKLKSLHIIEKREEYELYAHRLRNDKNGVPNILDCGYYRKRSTETQSDDELYVHVVNVSSGIDYAKRTKLKLLSDPVTGRFKNRLIVTIIADKITTSKSLRHPSLYRIRTDLDNIDVEKFHKV